ncbi:MAG: ATP-binding protein [Anaerolineaceae bacterium]|nr:ATP-binding protein [Anaerolineaceae bacterium]
MIRSLRVRLIFSHILPLVLTVPLIGLALLYILQSQLILTSLARELQMQAVLIMEMTSHQSTVWHSQDEARLFIARISPELNSEIMLFDAKGVLLASSNTIGQGSTESQVPKDTLSNALSGQSSLQIEPPEIRSFTSNVVDLMVPVVDENGNIVGVIRLNMPLARTWERFEQLRYLVLGVLVGGLVLGGLLGWALALSIERPLRQATDAVYSLSTGQRLDPLPEKGPREIQLLLHAFNNLTERLHTLEEGRRRLLANLVHEIGRPLGALRSAIQALLNGADQEADLRQELLHGMDREMLRLQHLMDELANFYDRTTGSLELNRQAIQIDQWLPEVVAPWRETATAGNLRFDMALSPQAQRLFVDPERLSQAVGNLLSNAIKYTPPGGAVRIATGLAGERYWIRVEDNGPGIPANEHEKIFTPFYRGSTARRFSDGMGLGLSIANDVVLAHGGQLTIESAPGQGSKFTIWLDSSLV